MVRHWRLAAFTLFVICIESGTYRATSLVVHRDRPDVHRLETLPVNESFPSGHTAASVALFCGLLLVLASCLENATLRLLLWSLAVAIPGIRDLVAHAARHAPPHRRGCRRADGHRRARRHRLRLSRGRCCRGAARSQHPKERAHDEGRGRRTRRQDDRRRARRASLRARRGAGVTDPLWSEVPKSKYAPERVKRVLDEGAELVFVWGGDGMVQRSVDVLAGSGATLAIIPAGTANLFASSLDIPSDIEQAVEIGLNGRDRQLDVGKINGERFAVMAGAGLDARMIHEADGELERPLRTTGLRLDGVEESPRGTVQGTDRDQRRALVRGQSQLRPARERRVAVRRSRGLRQCAARTMVCSRSA